MKRTKNVLLIVLWSAGTFLIWAWVEPEPRWHGAWSESILGRWDEQTIVTAPVVREVYGASAGYFARGPVQFRDLETGIVKKECLGPDDRFGRVCMDNKRRFTLEDRIDSDKKIYRLRLYDPIAAKEITSFHCRANPMGLVWWEISPDGAISAFEHHDDTGPSIFWHEVATGKLLREFPGYHGTFHFTTNGQFFFAEKFSQEQKIRAMTVWDVASGRELGTVVAPAESIHRDGPAQVSPDGRVLVDRAVRVWDVSAGKLRFQFPDLSFGAATFSADGRHLIVDHGSWIGWHDIEDGAEKHRLRIAHESAGRSAWLELSADGRHLLSAGTEMAQLSDWQVWLGRTLRIDRWNNPGPVQRSVFVDLQTRSIALDTERQPYAFVGGKQMITLERSPADQRQTRFVVWDFPPRKPALWLASLIAAWSAMLGVLLYWGRRMFATSRSKSPPAAKA